MRKSNWTPSIVPNDNDQNVYLVVDDFGRDGRAYREADVEQTDLETVIIDLLAGEYKNPVQSSHSTLPRSGLRMYRPTWRTSCASAAICKSETCRSVWKSSWTSTRAAITMYSCPFRCAWFEQCHSRT